MHVIAQTDVHVPSWPLRYSLHIHTYTHTCTYAHTHVHAIAPQAPPVLHHHHKCLVLGSIDHGLCVGHQPGGVGRPLSPDHEEDRPIFSAPVAVIDKVPLLPGLQGERGNNMRSGRVGEGKRGAQTRHTCTRWRGPSTQAPYQHTNCCQICTEHTRIIIDY